MPPCKGAKGNETSRARKTFPGFRACKVKIFRKVAKRDVDAESMDNGECEAVPGKGMAGEGRLNEAAASLQTL